ncbi:MAG: TRAP transporter substrate-binding protein [Roseitalea sp.]|jgi:tripartite ATP-independent transporter DctP family solute receptor|nr:TRAP transporter substrate-binding protein [Roseitalea sp.]MBO6720478.1 TRAP transporter substrate-binding protein [Roseitalea sp.]MBO6743625.1 TRAP transporter substrate-binding protein [Roseitalea sp.]
MKNTAMAAIVAVATALGASTALAEQTVKAAWSDPNDPQIAPTSAFMQVFEASLERFSGGAFDVELYPNGQLGDQAAAVQQVRRGDIEFANVVSGVVASLLYEPLSVLDMPYLFESRSHFREAMSNDHPYIADLLDSVAEETGVRILFLQPYGFRNMTTKETPVAGPADLDGMEMRTMNVVPHQKMMEALGANPVPIPFLELYTSLQTGVVDGQENTPANIVIQNFDQVQGHMTETQHVMTTAAFITNEAWFRGLSDAERGAILHAGEEAMLAYDGVGAVQDMLSVTEIRDKGVEVYTPTPEEMEQFRVAVAEPTRAWAAENLGEEFVAAFFAHMEQFEGAF